MAELTLTPKAAKEHPGVTLAQFRAAGWTDDVLKAHGLAGVVTEPIYALSCHGEYNRNSLPPGTAAPNVFGIKDLAEVSEAFRKFAGKDVRYPGGWSYEQQMLYAFDLLARRRILKQGA